MALMALGLFVFTVGSVPYDSKRRSTEQRWGSKDRAGASPAYQYLGPGEDTLTLSGLLMPELTGGPANLDTLRAMAAQGKAWILIDGTGRDQGKWFIKTLEETSTHPIANGLARRIEFSLSLTRDHDDGAAQLGNLMDSLPATTVGGGR